MNIGKYMRPVYSPWNRIEICPWITLRIRACIFRRVCTYYPITCIIIPFDRFLLSIPSCSGSVVACSYGSTQIFRDRIIECLTDINSRDFKFVISSQFTIPVRSTPRTPGIRLAINCCRRKSRLLCTGSQSRTDLCRSNLILAVVCYYWFDRHLIREFESIRQS